MCMLYLHQSLCGSFCYSHLITERDKNIGMLHCRALNWNESHMYDVKNTNKCVSVRERASAFVGGASLYSNYVMHAVL